MRRTLVLIMLLVTAKCIFSQSYSAEIERKITQVENSLFGAIRLEGDSLMSLEQRMQFHKVPSVSIAVINNYRLEWARAYGLADKQTNTKATSQTLYQAASISKSLNGVGALLLVQEKKVDLGTDINQYLTSWKFPYDSLSNGKKISLSHLLSHSAGLSVHGFPGYEIGQPLPTIVQILDGQQPANTKPVRSMFEPGKSVKYSGGGTTISQLLLTDVTKKAYGDYMQEKVLNPMGMTSSFYHQPPPAARQGYLSTGYDEAGNEIKNKYHVYPEQAAAGLWTNPTDLSNYIIETQLSYAGKSKKVLDQQTTRLRLTPFNGNEAALGVFIVKKGNHTYFSHGGANEGFRCIYYGSVEDGNGVVVMLNSDNGGIMNEIVNSVAAVYGWKDFLPAIKKKIVLPDSLLNSYTGNYEVSPNITLTITNENGQLMGQPTGQSKEKLHVENETTFFVLVVDAKLEFVKGASGTVEKLILHQNGRQISCKKLK